VIQRCIASATQPPFEFPKAFFAGRLDVASDGNENNALRESHDDLRNANTHASH
jgi:hypothetical protein